MLFECVHKSTIHKVDGDAENHGDHILDHSCVEVVTIGNGGGILAGV